MSNSIEDKDAPALKSKLQSLGFERVLFEPKTSNRFIVKIEGFPSYVIKGVQLPNFSNVWKGAIVLECYNPINIKLEELAMELVKKSIVDIKVQLLSPTAEVDTEWNLIGREGNVSFGNLNWSNDGDANLIYIRFQVESAEISYPHSKASYV